MADNTRNDNNNTFTSDRPTNEFGSGSSNFGASGTGASNFGSGGTGSENSGLGSGVSGFNVQSGTDRGMSSDVETCAHCGQPMHTSGSIEQFLGKIGLTESMISNLKSQMGNVDVENYLETARNYLKDAGMNMKSGSSKAKEYAKDNPGMVAAGFAVLAAGAGILLRSLRDREERGEIIIVRDETEPRL
jgi:hypothetical protein